MKSVNIKIPTGKTLIYNGSLQKGVDEGNGYTLTSHQATNVGTYTAIATLTDPEHTTWVDKTIEPKKITYTISKATGYINLSSSGENISKETVSASFTIENYHGGELTVTTTGGIATLDSSTKTVTVTNLTTVTSDTIKIKVTSAATNNYTEATAIYTLKIVEDTRAPWISIIRRVTGANGVATYTVNINDDYGLAGGTIRASYANDDQSNSHSLTIQLSPYSKKSYDIGIGSSPGKGVVFWIYDPIYDLAGNVLPEGTSASHSY